MGLSINDLEKCDLDHSFPNEWCRQELYEIILVIKQALQCRETIWYKGRSVDLSIGEHKTYKNHYAIFIDDECVAIIEEDSFMVFGGEFIKLSSQEFKVVYNVLDEYLHMHEEIRRRMDTNYIARIGWNDEYR